MDLVNFRASEGKGDIRDVFWRPGEAERSLPGKRAVPAYFIEPLLRGRQGREGRACPGPAGSSEANENKAKLSRNTSGRAAAGQEDAQTDRS